MVQLKKLAASVSIALAAGYAGQAAAVIGSPGAIAESYMKFESFRICAGNGASTLATACAGGPAFFEALSGSESAKATVERNGVSLSVSSPIAGLTGVDFSATATIGAGFTPGVVLPAAGLPTGYYAGATSVSTGFALNPATGATVLLHSQVQLNSGGTGGSLSEQVLDAGFAFFSTATSSYELSFQAIKDLRAALGQANIAANAGTEFTVTITNTAGDEVFTWSPDGGSTNTVSCDATFGCVSATEHSDTVNLQNDISSLPIGPFFFDVDPAQKSGFMEVEVTLDAGGYFLNFTAKSSANAALLPEPGSLALLGLGLLGLGMSVRRRISK